MLVFEKYLFLVDLVGKKFYLRNYVGNFLMVIPATQYSPGLGLLKRIFHRSSVKQCYEFRHSELVPIAGKRRKSVI